MPSSVLIIGSSHVNYLKSFVKQKDERWNFDIDPETRISFYGVSGGRINSSDHINRIEKKINLVRPDGLIVHIGGNDLDNSEINQEDVRLCLHLVAILDTFVGRHRIKSVAIMQLMPRMSTRHLQVDRYNDYVITFNRILKDELTHNRIMTYWKLSGLKHAAVAIYRDGVHLNQDGLIRYYRNVHGAILTLLKSIV